MKTVKDANKRNEIVFLEMGRLILVLCITYLFNIFVCVDSNNSHVEFIYFNQFNRGSFFLLLFTAIIVSWGTFEIRCNNFKKDKSIYFNIIFSILITFLFTTSCLLIIDKDVESNNFRLDIVLIGIALFLQPLFDALLMFSDYKKTKGSSVYADLVKKESKFYSPIMLFFLRVDVGLIILSISLKYKDFISGQSKCDFFIPMQILILMGVLLNIWSILHLIKLQKNE